MMIPARTLHVGDLVIEGEEREIAYEVISVRCSRMFADFTDFTIANGEIRTVPSRMMLEIDTATPDFPDGNTESR